jgi:hypothetical protein
MSGKNDEEYHLMELIHIGADGERDLELEFLCTTCGLTERISLFDILSKGNFTVSHANNEDGANSLVIKLKTGEGQLPQIFKDFIESL